MTPEDVLAALAARAATVDFRKPDPLVEAVRESKIGNRTPLNWRAVRNPDGTINVEESWPSLRTARGRGNRGVSKSSLHEAAADALLGMRKRSWQTIQTAIGIETGGARDAVARRLMREAWRSQLRDRFWPAKIDRKRCICGRHASPWYADDLVELVVLHLEHPDEFRTHDAKADWFGISNRWWRSQMSKPFDLLSGHVWAWYNEGIIHINQRLSRRRRETA